MSEHKARVSWKRETQDFQYDSYDRTHKVEFEGGQNIHASAAPAFVGNAAHANPEEMLAAALSSCHMLTFLAFCAKSKLVVNSYEDNTIALLEKNSEGMMAVTRIKLHPVVTFEGQAPDSAKFNELHEKAHKYCMIANSLKCEVSIESNI